MPEVRNLANSIEPPTTPAFSECEEITDDRPICQGDIFQWVPASADPYQLLGVIVTADCDIAYAKHHGIFSYVPILAVTDYLRLFYLPRRIDRGVRLLAEELTKTLLVEELTDQIHSYQKDNLPDFPEPVSKEAALRWIKTRGAAEVADELGIDDANARQRFVSLVEDYNLIDDAVRSELFANQVDALLKLRIRTGLSREQASARVWDEMRTAAVRELPGDALFIGRVTAHLGIGYVAYLRLVREIGEKQVAVKQTQLLGPTPAAAKRIARLRSPYIFRLTQQLGDVFASIGLPVEYEDHRQRLMDGLGRNHGGKGQPDSTNQSA